MYELFPNEPANGLSIAEPSHTALRISITIGIIKFGTYIASIILFIGWFTRAYKNLYRLGLKHLRHKASMAIWSWFIPIIMFFRPVQIMHAIWTETQEAIKKQDTSYQIINGELIIGIWWVLFITTCFINNILLRLVLDENNLNLLIDSSLVLIIKTVIQIGEALSLIIILDRLSKMELKLAREVKKYGGIVQYK